MVALLSPLRRAPTMLARIGVMKASHLHDVREFLISIRGSFIFAFGVRFDDWWHVSYQPARHAGDHLDLRLAACRYCVSASLFFAQSDPQTSC
jgi:hypothetical protein